MRKHDRLLRITGGVAIAFGLLTVVSGGTTLLGALEMGAVVLFVLWFNTLAGLAYVVAGLGLWQERRWAWPLSLAIFAATLLVFAAFGLHVAQGGAFEMRTVFAMALRSAVWGAIALVARQLLTRQALSGR
ncbi:hypothetical protein [Yoonia vestfoldensis]|uniref:Membrane protein n=1 Tax=Yoonia vestfoldensis TaxID=245188 RepID=A0A1Y0EAL1_9RHOB|nr:hypothetical protein [Yoonia vestfoldensis]ARU00430.1 membrane protein [Yoonia vestfoldensis]